MAYMCIYSPSHECDGCDECRSAEYDFDDFDERAADIEREEEYFGEEL